MKTLIPIITAFLLAPISAFSAGQIPIFDGKTLDGWDYDPAIWRVADGMITGGSTTEKIKANYFICTKRSYQNFELRMKIKCSGDPKTGMINSGIQIRSVRVPGGAHMSGYQVDCGAGWFGKIYDEARRNRVIATPVDQAALDKVVDVFGWNEYRIRAEGPRIQTWINGVLALDYTEPDKNIALDGQLGPQVHSGGAALVQVKDVTIEELPPTPGAPTWESLGGVEAARKLVAPPPKKPAAAAPKPMKEGNAVQGTAKTAAEQQKLFHLADGYEIELVVQESDGLGKFVSVYFDQRGRMWTQTAFEYPVDGNENPAAADALYQSKAKDKVVVYPRAALNAPLPSGGLTKPTVFADGLAMPLGILPWGAGDACYIQHGHDLKLFKDTDGDGRADTHDVILTGFGVQDSHLFPHQFTRAPGGWIWMAQGLFNNSKVRKPDGEAGVDWPKCSMAKMRPDGSDFEVTSTGPNNIWGLVITGEGETFIQEANDFGYPVMPFHEYAYYPGGMEPLRKSYQPEFPATAEFRMGGTGLSGLALGEGAFRKLTPTLKADGLCMIVANPITSKVQTLAMHRDGPRWRLEQLPDLVTCADPFFRPVGLTNGPDGCIYIVDWYNKIISHNEVPRAHPDRDKTRGRIWRVKAKGAPLLAVPDFTKLSGDELIAKLGAEPLAQSHLAWQAIADRGLKELVPRLREIVLGVGRASRLSGDASRVADANVGARSDANARSDVPGETPATTGGTPVLPDARRIPALWALREISTVDLVILDPLLGDTSSHIRREALRAARVVPETFQKAGWEGDILLKRISMFSDDPSPEVVAEVIRTLAKGGPAAVPLLVTNTIEPDPNPRPELLAPSSRGGKLIKVREAYDREFQRFLARTYLERQPEAVIAFLDSAEGKSLSAEEGLLASLALEPKASAARVAKLLPQLQRAPGQEEVLRLAQFPDEPGVGEALRAALNNPATRTGVLEALLATRTRLESTKLAPLLTDAAKQLLAGPDADAVQLGIQLAGAFQLTNVEDALVALLERVGRASRPSGSASRGTLPNVEPQPNANPRLNAPGETPAATGGTPVLPVALSALRALSQIGSGHSELFASIAATAADPQLRTEATLALATSRAPDAGERLFKLWPDIPPTQRRTALERLASTKPGAKSIVAAIGAGTLKKDELDGPTVEKLQAVLGDDPALTALLGELAALFRPVLTLNGQDDAWTETGVTLDGPFTVECWARLEPKIGNDDGILGAPGQLDMNFFGEKFRVWVGDGLHDVAVSSKPVTAGLWTHVAAVRDAQGRFQLYQDGELTAEGTKPAPRRFENVRLGWTGTKGGTAGALDEFRIWNVARTADEIRRDFDRTFDANAKPAGLVFTGPGKLQPGAKLTKTSDFPPVLSAAEATALDAKFAKYRALAAQPGDATRGKNTAMLCSACHLFKGQGGAIGPDLSGVGAMGTEAILRNLLTPNAAMEAGYRIYRVELKSGDLVDAFFVSEDKEAVVVRIPGTPDRRIAKSEIRSTKYLRRSLMPEGLLEVLPPEQASDLFAYLLSLK